MTPRYCVLIPTFDNPGTLEQVVTEARRYVEDVLVVDDGSGPEARRVAQGLADRSLAMVVFRQMNGGKGAAVRTGLSAARERGYTHAIQVDADGQHDTEDLPRFVEASNADPAALVLGRPVFDESAPKSRLYARRISIFWCAVETMGRRVGDPLCGFRVYPIAETLAQGAVGEAMDFDPEIAVRLAWAGLPIHHVDTRVRYLSRQEGGISHFRPWRDTFSISVMHARLCITGLVRWALGLFRNRETSA